MLKKYVHIFFAVIFISSILVAQEKTIPDYSSTPRKDVPVEFTWKIDDLYPGYEAWQKEKEELIALASQVDTKKNRLDGICRKNAGYV